MPHEENALQTMNGRLFALEALLTQIVWCWAMSENHPPTALAKALGPVERQISTIAEDPDNDPIAMAAARHTVQGIGEVLERALHQAALERASPQDSGKA